MSWDKTITAMTDFMKPVWKYLGMWVVFAILGAVLMLAGFGTKVGEWVFVVAVGFEMLAVAVGFACLVIATWLLKTKLEKLNDSHNCDS